MNIDWTKPLELMDGTPVVLMKGPGEWGECVIDLPEGTSERLDPSGCDTGRLYTLDGRHMVRELPDIRNRADTAAPETPTTQLKTLRDEFAMAALTWIPRPKWGGPLDSVCVASEAYDIADAMMAERERGQ